MVGMRSWTVQLHGLLGPCLQHLTGVRYILNREDPAESLGRGQKGTMDLGVGASWMIRLSADCNWQTPDCQRPPLIRLLCAVLLRDLHG